MLLLSLGLWKPLKELIMRLNPGRLVNFSIVAVVVFLKAEKQNYSKVVGLKLADL